MVVKEFKDANDFIREVLFLDVDELKEFAQVTDSGTFENVLSIAQGVFTKDNKYYARYSFFDWNNTSWEYTELCKHFEIGKDEFYAYILKEIFPVTFKVKRFL